MFDRDSLSWRTYRGTSISGLGVSSLRFPRSGSMRSGIVFRRASLVRRIHDSGLFYWPTPRASSAMARSLPSRESLLGRGRVRNLEEQLGVIEGKCGFVNPEWVELLMGFPRGFSGAWSG